MFTQFEDVENTSLNRVSDLRPGDYLEKLQEFEKDDGSVRMTLRIFSIDGEDSPAVIDAILIDEENTVIVQDFIRLQNGAWRSGDGLVNFDLTALFPTRSNELFLTGEIDDSSTVIRVTNEFDVEYL